MSSSYNILKLLTKSFKGTVSAFTSEDMLAGRFKDDEDFKETPEFFAKHLASLFQDIATSTYTCADMSRFLIIYFIIFTMYEDIDEDEGLEKSIGKLIDMLSSSDLDSKEIKEIVNSGIKELDEIEGVKVLVKKAEGKKCPRCWKIFSGPCVRCEVKN